MICRKGIAEAFWGPIETNPGFVEGHTWEGGPVACAAGIAIIQEIMERDLCGNSRAQGARLRTGFERIAKKHGVVGDIRGKGLFQAMEFVADTATKAQFPAKPGFGVRVGKRALEKGLLCRFDPHWIAFGPALTVTGEQIEEMVAILDQSVGEILNEI
jgi:adenosylmethionine-8-amino-7-oxononanoate aminotransferase